MKHVSLFLLLLVSFISYSQNPKITHHGNDTIEVISYHKNGHVKDSVWKTIEILVGKREVIDPKHPGDSIVINIETPFGTQKTYYKSGNLKSLVYYGKKGAANRLFLYRKKGSLTAYKESPYGIKKLYNKKGKQRRQSDYNKNKTVGVPKKYHKQVHISQSKYAGKPLAKALILSGVTKQLKIKQGALFSVMFTNDTTPLRHCVFEGILNDSILLTKYSYDLTKSDYRLKPDSIFLVSANQVSTIYYARNNVHKTHFAASFMEFAGFNMMLLPVIAVPLFVGVPALLTPPILAVVAAGIPVYICSKYLFKKTVPKTYNLSEWKIKF